MRKAALFGWGALLACVCAACTSILGDFTVSTATADGGAGGGGGGGVDAGDAAPPLALLTDAIQVSAGGVHSCAVRTGGSVVCWGNNPSGELGQPVNVTPQSPRPLTVQGVVDVKLVSAGLSHTCALDKSGNVWCWGGNTHGQLGQGTITAPQSPWVPVQVLDSTGSAKLTGATAISARDNYTCALTPSGIYCWGDNGAKQCGDPGPAQDEVPHQVASLGSTTLNLGGGAAHACAVYQGAVDGGTGQGPPTVECWGTEQHGELGDGQLSNQTSTPLDVNLPSFAPGPVFGGLDHTCVVAAQSSGVLCWGNNDKGQLGSATVPPQPSPTAVPLGGGQALTTLALGDSFTCGLLASGAAQCVGANDAAQLGSGATNTTPNTTLTSVTGVTGAKQISAGGAHACALVPPAQGTGQGGAVFCWGADGAGQLGDGAASRPSSAPVQVVAPPS